MDLAAGLMHQPEAVAADRVHMRVDDGDRRGHRDHRLDGVAALGENGATGFGREMMGRGDRSRAEDGRVDHQGLFKRGREQPCEPEGAILLHATAGSARCVRHMGFVAWAFEE